MSLPNGNNSTKSFCTAGWLEDPQTLGPFQGLTGGRAAVSHDKRLHLNCEVSRSLELLTHKEAKFGQLNKIFFPVRILLCLLTRLICLFYSHLAFSPFLKY